MTPMTDEEIMTMWWDTMRVTQARGGTYDDARLAFARIVRGETPRNPLAELRDCLREAVTIMEMHRDLHGTRFFPALPDFIARCVRVVERDA